MFLTVLHNGVKKDSSDKGVIYDTVSERRSYITYHVYKETSWSNAKLNDKIKVELETDTKLLSTNPYACAIKASYSNFVRWKTVGHILREISRYVYFFIENGKVLEL